MTFNDAMGLVRNKNARVTRASWSVLCTVTFDEDSEDEPIFLWRIDNCDGTLTGSGGPYRAVVTCRILT
jgi:hypothetical protein